MADSQSRESDGRGEWMHLPAHILTALDQYPGRMVADRIRAALAAAGTSVGLHMRDLFAAYQREVVASAARIGKLLRRPMG